MDLTTTSKPTFYHDLHSIICIRGKLYYVLCWPIRLSAVVFRVFYVFFVFLKMFLVGLATGCAVMFYE